MVSCIDLLIMVPGEVVLKSAVLLYLSKLIVVRGKSSEVAVLLLFP